jgi:hypothetical protein
MVREELRYPSSAQSSMAISNPIKDTATAYPQISWLRETVALDTAKMFRENGSTRV